MMKEGGNSTGKSQPIVKISKPQFSLPFLDVNKFNQLQLFVLDLHLQSRQMNISFNVAVFINVTRESFLQYYIAGASPRLE